MDAASRAELDALRARAYGPAADIHGDPVALARLAQLEAELANAAANAPILERARPGDAPGVEREGAASEAEPPEAGGVPPARRWTPLLAAAGILVLGALVVPRLFGPAGPEPTGTAEPAASTPFAYAVPEGFDVLLNIPIDGSFGSYHGLPETPVPVLEPLGDVRWSEPLGTYYGIRLALAGVDVDGDGDDDETLCVVATYQARSSYTCRSRASWERGAVFVSVPYVAIEPAERPDGLDPSESLGFWWTPDDRVHVLRGPARLPSEQF